MKKKRQALSFEDERLIPKPKTRFLKVKCDRCDNEQVIFSAPATQVKCLACEHVLALPKASKGKLSVKKAEAL